MVEQNHERFEELALGHVLGGLPSADAAAFRAHLVECRDCRLRVAELRDIAADLAATEREEKRLAAVATQVAERESGEDEGAARWLRSRWIPVAAVVAIISVLGILFWNYHLRRVTSEYTGVVQRQEEVLGILSSGEALPVEVDRGAAAVAAMDGGSIGVSISALPTEVLDGYIVIWRLDDGQVVGDPIGGPTSDPAAFAVEPEGADELVVTGHPPGAATPEEPGDTPLVRVDIPARD